MATPSVMNGMTEQLNGDDSVDPEDYASCEESEVSLDQEASPEPVAPAEIEGEEELPQCKIKRNYACPECPYFTQNPRIFLYHLKNFHQHKIRIYECPHCLYASKHSQKLQRHLQMVHIEKKFEAGRRSYEEVGEEEEEVNETEFFSAPLTPEEDRQGKMFKCGVCPFSSRSESLIARHEKVVHLKKRAFRCTKCNYVTHMKARFTKHVKYHSMPMIKCELCDFKTPYKWNLDRHMKNHSGDGAFKCSICTFTADIKQSLTVHEMNHHVPPVGQGAPSRRRNRVGASDSQQAEEEEEEERRETSLDHEQAEAELLRLEREGEDHQVQMQAFTDLSMLNEIEVTKKPDNPPPMRKPNMKKPKQMAQFSSRELTMKVGQKVVKPGDVIQQKNGNMYVKKLKCRVCNYRAAWESEMTRHEQRVHGLDDKKCNQKPARPIPNLIPIQNKPGTQQGPPPPPTPPPALPLSRPTLPLMHQQSRAMMQQKQLMHQMPTHPHFQQNQQNMNRHPFLPQHMQHQFSMSMSTPQTHNLPSHYPQQLPSRFAQPKNVMPKLKSQYPMSNHHQKPVQSKPSPPPPAILKIPTPTKVRTPTSSPAILSPDKTMTEKDLNDICAKSCPTSSLKDFASLMGGDEAFKSEGEKTSPPKFSSNLVKEKSESSENQTREEGPKSPEAMKKKNSFFDELKAKFKTGESCNLLCNQCGHESKCLSESLRHQKIHRIQNLGNSSGSGTVFSNADLSSTRCQYCRQRCKTSADLMVHLKACPEANRVTSDPLNVDDGEEESEVGELGEERMEVEDNEGEDEDKSEEGFEDPDGPHPMENKVFVWTNQANGEEDGLDDEYDCGSQSPSSDCVFGIETAPGIGAVTSTNKAAAHGNMYGQAVPTKEVKPKTDNSVNNKKVYKCPHCSFWASTASRFHVHIVGHLNKKPFECSLCCYRSNWRWDITKHIRLKTVRDSTHQRAKVLMTDETGRRNYSKYNKYLTMMRVHEPMAESSGTGLRGKKLTQSFEPIETPPTPPKLTPAPHTDGNNSSPEPSNQFKSIYQKPPTLQSSFDMKRKGTEDSEDEPPKKKGTLENKKTMWKCKKCLFRDSDRAVVLAHVKGHYRNQGLQNNQSETPDEASSKKLRLQDEVPQPYMCGHCHQVSQWKHVIQRHCRLKHNGDVKVNLAPRQQPEETQTNKNEAENEAESYMCETCPFVVSNQQGMDEHMEKHFERPGANLKCYFCAFYVDDKDELMEHISLHGEPTDADENYTNKGEDPNYTYSSEGESGEPFMNKRYRCTVCPYVSNSKTQFLYHKQFHRPRGAPFQCTLCSYNVPRRHFLQQHLRLHGVSTPLPRRKGLEQVDLEKPLNIKDIDTSNMAEIPLVWVSKLGSLTKMFKCRYCPHVNIRKSNIQEHEKMHGIRTKPNPEGSSPIPQQQHHCPECNYICNNAGVLSSHAKVHQGLFGQVCGLVDLSRSDDEQIKELNDLLGREEEGPPEITPDEVFKDFKDASPQLQSSPDKDGQIFDNRVMHFCQICPARFLYPKELEIHLRFHNLQLQFQCDSCSYTARQQPHLLAHYKVHTDEYQDRTTALCEVYQISDEHPKPKIAVIVDGSEEVGPAWVVVERQKLPAKDPQNEYDLDEAPSEVSQHGSRIVTKQFSCDNCPAKFFKSVALQYHSKLHGSTNPHKCRVCDYAVKTYGNLIKHETVHEDLEPRVKLKNKSKRSLDNIPTSGTELFKQKTEANQKVASAPPPPPPLHIDPEFGVLMHGSPEFVYPTYLKNGRLKEKRYKCHKCPSAFEKREQYKVHLSLHGSKQRYNCERCDYSVKYYANYIQHLRKHQSNDVTKADRKSSTEKNSDDLTNDDGSEIITETHHVDEIQPQPPLSSRASKKMKLSMADQQTTMLMQQRIISSSVSTPEVTNRCPFCPYSNHRKEGVGSHVKCHSNVKGGAYNCKFCDYTVPQQHFLREHNKVHFSSVKSNRPEAYMKCDRLELWAEPTQQNTDGKSGEGKASKVLIFKDLGTNFKTNRFLPAFELVNTDNLEGERQEKMYINLKTGEIESAPESIENSDKEDEKENVDVVRKDKSSKDVQSCSLEKEDSKNNQLIKMDVGYEMDSTTKENYTGCENGNLTIENEANEENTSMVIDGVKTEDNFGSPLNETDSGSQILPQEYNVEDKENLFMETDKNQPTETELTRQQNGQNDISCVKTEICDSTTDTRLGPDSFSITLEDYESHELQANKENKMNESQSTVDEEINANESQDGSVQQESNGESVDKSETKDSSSGSSDSDTEDSSSDSSSSSEDSDDSTSSSAESSQPL